MLEIIALFLILLGVFTLFINSISGLIYALLAMSIVVMLVGVIKGRPTNKFVEKTH
jgi:hypothetical protein